MVQITLEQISDDLLSYLQRAQAGESFLIIAAGKPIAEIKPALEVSQLQPKTALEQFQSLGLVGCMDGQESLSTDHPEIQDYLRNKRQQGLL